MESGLYFAGSEDVAKSYRSALSRPTVENPLWRLNGEPVARGTDNWSLAAALENRGAPNPNENMADFLNRNAGELDKQAAFAEKAYGPDAANMYQMKADALRNADPDKLTYHQPEPT